MAFRVDLLPGTLEVLVLKAVSLGPLHGLGVLLRIEQITGGALLVEQGASIRPFSALSNEDCSRLNGACPTTTVAPSSTG